MHDLTGNRNAGLPPKASNMLRLAHFLNPWYNEATSSRELQEQEQGQEQEQEQEEEQETQQEVLSETDEERADAELMQLDSVVTTTTTTTEVSEVRVTQETLDVIEIVDDAAEASNTLNSEITLVASSQEPTSTPEGSVVDPAERVHSTKHRLEHEESALSGHDSDAVADRKESRRTRRKPLQPSTSIRPTRRTTRSLAAKAEEENNMDKEAMEESQTSDAVNKESSPAPEEISSIQQEDDSQKLEPSNQKGKKKKKSKQSKKDKAEEIEAVERDAGELGDRIAAELRKSNEIIQESKALRKKMEALDEVTAEVLHDAKDPFSPAVDDGDEVSTTIAAREEHEDQTFHSTVQFDEEDADDYEAETSYSQGLVYSYSDDDNIEETADTVKYYPPESPDAIDENEEEHELAADQIQQKEDLEIEKQKSNTNSIAFTRRSPSPQPFESGLAVPEDIEFSPMQSRSVSPSIKLPSTSSGEHFVDCPPIATPKPSRIKDALKPEEPKPVGKYEQENKNDTPINLDKFGMHPVHNIEFLEEFFRRQRGHLLTYKQAEYCCLLIMDSIIPSDIPKNGAFTDIFPVKATAQSENLPAKASTSSSERTKLSIPRGSVRRAAPLAILQESTGLNNDVPKQTPLPSLDEYLEIEKYKGVEWNDLPNHVKVKRFLEWKGTEPPEVAKKRRMEERAQIRKENAEYWVNKEKEKKAESLVAEKTAKEMDITKTAAAHGKGVIGQSPSVLKRKISATESVSNDDKDLISAEKKPVLKNSSVIDLSPPVSLVKAKAGPSNNARPQTVAEKILAIVHKDSNNDEDQAPSNTAFATVFPTSTKAAKPISAGLVSEKSVPEKTGISAPLSESDSPSKSSTPFNPTVGFGAPSKLNTTSPTINFGIPVNTKAGSSMSPSTFAFGSSSAKPSSGSIFNTPVSTLKEDTLKPLSNTTLPANPFAAVSASKSPFGIASNEAPTSSAMTSNNISTAPPTFSFSMSKSNTATVPTLATSPAKSTRASSNFGISASSSPNVGGFGTSASSDAAKLTTSRDTSSSSSFGFGQSPVSSASPGVPKAPPAFGFGFGFGQASFATKSKEDEKFGPQSVFSSASQSVPSNREASSFSFRATSPGVDSASASKKVSFSGVNSNESTADKAMFGASSMGTAAAFGFATGSSFGSGTGGFSARGSAKFESDSISKKDSRSSSVNPFTAFMKKPSTQEQELAKSKTSKRKNRSEDDDEVIILGDDDSDNGANAYNYRKDYSQNERGDGAKLNEKEDEEYNEDEDYNQEYDQENSRNSSEINDDEYGYEYEGGRDGEGTPQSQDSQYEEDDEDKENRPIFPNTNIFSSTSSSSEPMFGQPRRVSSRALDFGQQQQQQSRGQSPKLPEYDFEFDPAHSEASGDVTSYRKSQETYADYSDEFDEEEVELLEDLEQDAEGSVSPLASPVLSP
ncbi:hypothetical protein BX616_002239 [Lobosporangium transversale]|nr:hypothetical protein BX616_002239 [Lobosporangium transversale]